MNLMKLVCWRMENEQMKSWEARTELATNGCATTGRGKQQTVNNGYMLRIPYNDGANNIKFVGVPTCVENKRNLKLTSKQTKRIQYDTGMILLGGNLNIHIAGIGESKEIYLY